MWVMSPSSGKSVSSDQELGLTSKQSEPATDFRKCKSISTASDMSNIQKRIGKKRVSDTTCLARTWLMSFRGQSSACQVNIIHAMWILQPEPIFICMPHTSVPYETFMQTHTQVVSGAGQRWEHRLSCGWEAEIRRTGLVKPWALKTAERVPTLMLGSIIHPVAEVYVHICCLKGSERRIAECWRCIVPPLSFMFLMSRSSKATRLIFPTSSRSLCCLLFCLCGHSLSTHLNKAFGYVA